nr:hypothetical protein [Ancylobacter sonchi]
MQDRSALGDRLLDGEHRRQRLVLDLDERRRRAGGGDVDGGDRSDRLANVADLVDGKGGFVLDHQSHIATADLGAGYHSLHAGQGESTRQVISEDPGMGVGTQHQRTVQHAGQCHVLGKSSRAARLLQGFEPRHCEPDGGLGLR